MLRRSLLIGIGALLVSSCEDPMIDPFVEGKHFTVYGFLNPFEDEHFVRVVPVRRFPEDIPERDSPHAAIDAVVTSINLSTGGQTVWTHTLARLDDGTFGHVFRAQFRVSAGVTYRLVVRRSDGAESTAETTIPTGMTAEALESTLTNGEVVQVIRWKNVPKVDDINVVYCAAPVGSTGCADGADGGGLLIRYGTVGRRVGNDWEVPVRLSRDFRFVREVANLDPETALQLNSLQMRVLGLDPKWTVIDDPDQFAQPNALNNVENGFGYWGSVGNGLLDWVPDATALTRLGIVPAN